jgi:hypothetical protein
VATGTATVDFGAAPGTNIAEIAVTGQAAILAASHVEAWMMGSDSTASHNAYEHAVVPLELHLAIVALTAGVGFTIRALTRLRLTGTFVVHWAWS